MLGERQASYEICLAAAALSAIEQQVGVGVIGRGLRSRVWYLTRISDNAFRFFVKPIDLFRRQAGQLLQVSIKSLKHWLRGSELPQ